MQAVTTVGLDIAKSVFQVHGVDARGNVVVRRLVASAASSRSYCAPDAASLREALPQASEE
jgi:hypothetical protein